MRSRATLFTALLAVGLFAVPHFAQASIPFFGPIIDKSWTVSSTGIQCALGWGAVITVINNIIELLITLAIVFIAPLMIAWSGFLMVINQGNPGKIEEAKKILTNTILGIVIALSGWMIVDALMAVLYNPGTTFGTWSSLITSGNALTCLPQQGVGTGLNQTTNGAGVGAGVTVVTTGATGAATMSAAAIQSAATAALVYKNQVCTQAATQGIPTQCGQLLGILGVESAGNPSVTSGVGAIGLMQLMPTTAASNGVSACAGSSDTSPSAACVAALKDPTTNITAGVITYARLLNHFSGNQTYATAAYNGGSGTGVTSDGKKQAFAASTDCPGMYAWQCTINPGGFVETQNYVQNVAAVAQKIAL